MLTHHSSLITDGAAVTLIGEISFKGGIRTKGMHKRVRRITSARSKSFGKCLSVFKFNFILNSPLFLVLQFPYYGVETSLLSPGVFQG